MVHAALVVSQQITQPLFHRQQESCGMNRKVKFKYVFAMVMVFAGAVRLAVLVLGWDTLSEDPDSYARLAINWANSGTFGIETDTGVAPRAYRPPLYPWLLSWLVSNSELSRMGIVVLHFVLGLATVGLSYSIANRLDLRWPALPALAVACDPLLLRQSQFVMTETLAAFFVVMIWRGWLVLKCRPPNTQAVMQAAHFRQGLLALGLGVLCGLATLCRPTAAPWAVICALALLCTLGAPWKVRLTPALAFSLGVLLCIGPWSWRNRSQIGAPVWATTHGGYTLLLANNPLIYEHFRNNGPTRDWNAEPFHAAWAKRSASIESPVNAAYWLADTPSTSFPQSLPELEDDRLAYASARATMDREPWMFTRSCIYRVGWFWAPWPNTGSFLTKSVIGVWYGMAFLAALVGLRALVRERRLNLWVVPLGLVVSLTCVHAVYWSNMRMRGPLMSVVYVLGAVGLQHPRDETSLALKKDAGITHD